MGMVMFVFWRQVRDCCCCCSSRIAFVFAGCAALQHRCPCKGRANAIHDAHASSSLPLAQLARKACDNGGPSSCVLGPLPKQHGAPPLSRAKQRHCWHLCPSMPQSRCRSFVEPPIASGSLCRSCSRWRPDWASGLLQQSPWFPHDWQRGKSQRGHTSASSGSSQSRQEAIHGLG